MELLDFEDVLDHPESVRLVLRRMSSIADHVGSNVQNGAALVSDSAKPQGDNAKRKTALSE